MQINLQEMTIKVASPFVTPSSPAYRLPSWPPPRDWPVVIDENGVVVSRWGDPKWDVSIWNGSTLIIYFGDGEITKNFEKAMSIDPENADLLRMIATWNIWGPRAPDSVRSAYEIIAKVKRVVSLCSSNGISAARLMRYPQVLDQVPSVISASLYDQTISLFHRLYDAREELGFAIIDPNGLRRLMEAKPLHDHVQTPYIPPRIWTYQNKRLHECLNDFIAHREQLEKCFKFCLDAYVKAFGSLEAALVSGRSRRLGPFIEKSTDYQVSFKVVAARFGIAELLRKWVGGDRETLSVHRLSSYFSLVTNAGLMFVANYTMQRSGEIASLRTSCLLWEEDEKLGRVPIICGETTKTDPDSDARWIASPSVEIAIQAVSSIARMRMLCDRANPLIYPTKEDQDDPYLLSTSAEPWGSKTGAPYQIRAKIRVINNLLVGYPLLFDKKELRITSADLEIALRLTPNLPEDEFSLGEVWPLAWHQYRRTMAVNMFSSGDISDSTMQFQMKHSSRLMPLYYGRNHGRLHLNKKAEETVIAAMYESQAAMLKRAVSDDRFISPHEGRKEVLAVNILSAKEFKDLTAMSKRGTISFRENYLGGCMKAASCEYGGIESIARCAGGDGGKPCNEVLYDREKEPQVRADMVRLTEAIKQSPVGHPRTNALIKELRSMENYINAIAN